MGKKKPTPREDGNTTAVQGGGGGKAKKKNFMIDDDEYSVGTELSEEPIVQDEKAAPAPVGDRKRGKKKLVIDDDEYSVGTELSEEPEEKLAPAPAGGKKKGKKGKKSGAKDNDDEDEAEEKNIMKDSDEVENDDALMSQFTGKKKPKGKKADSMAAAKFALLGSDDNDDERSSVTKDGDGGGGDSEEESENVISFTGKKKSKSKKGAANKFTTSAFDAIGGDEFDENDSDNELQSDNEEEPVISFTGKKKPSKPSKNAGRSVFAPSTFDGLDDLEQSSDLSKEENDEVPPITFTGKKKKSSKSSKKSNSLHLNEENDEDVSDSKLDTGVFEEDATAQDDDMSEIMFSGKKKSSKKKNKTALNMLDNEARDDSLDAIDSEKPSLADSNREAEETKNKTQVRDDVSGTSKAKSKKKKGGKTVQEEQDEIDKILAELGEGPANPASAPSVPPPEEKLQVQPEPKDKTKKKKGGKTAEEEDEIDKILAELGEGQPSSKPVPSHAPAPSSQEEKDQPEAGEDTAEKETTEGVVESAAAKKKKKKKEKEKEKKAAAAAAAAPVIEEKQEEVKIESKGKVADKKVPKHVREMQERLARLKEAEEKKKKEEEERLRKEEEERRRQEELERLAEEKKRLKKEREKEKLLKKKQEGKLLTGKQKEEARRLELMRKQILANAGGLPIPTGETGKEGTKRPKYQTKKSRPSHGNEKPAAATNEITEVKETQHEIVSEVDSVDTEKVDEVESINTEEKSEVADAEENGIEEDEDDEEWDAKSWDDADLKLPGKSAFADEEVDAEPKAVVRKELKVAQSAARNSGAPSVGSKQAPVTAPVVTKNEDSKKREPESESKLKGKGARGAQKPVELPDQSETNLRSPICCIMGHVDTGKTKLLDCIRGTNVQEGEAGGITQQIGATYFPAENIRERTKELKADATLKVPGLLVIDTPGHESFTNLRSRGSGLCDIAILVVDIMHGLEQQTIESLNLLKMRNTEFIVALNKVDRLYGWKVCRNAPIQKAMKQQNKDVQFEFNTRLTQIVTQFKEQGINTELYYKNKDMGKDTFSIVPTSAISGEGIPDLLLLLVQWTQKTMVERLTFSNEVQCTVLEVKVIEGHGTTIDVVLVNGVLHEGDQIVVCGMQGPIATSIRALLTPHPMKELRVKGTYLHHKEIKAAQGIKITGQGLEHAIAGTSLYVVGPDDDLDDILESAMEDMRSVMSRIDKSGEGVYVQASTLGSLEALLEFLKTPEVSIPVSGIGIGPVHKKDVMKASVMLEKKKEYATILAFDVKVTPEARELSEELGVKIFCADIIYHLFDQFKAYIDNLKEEKKKEVAEEAVFPCVIKIVPECIFNKKDPIVMGVEILDGIARIGTPLCIPSKEFIDIGRIASIENNHKPVDYGKKGQMVAIKIVGSNSEEQQKMFGRHFDADDELISKISRRSIDILKENFRKDLTVEEWRLLVKLKNIFKIQ
ncbi:PREDICTED: eukaryotic translation initiation factor 5B-like isoform X2 [Ipomoea nil]|uniref:eukaryotic translation initiation factor 5B-like isoform X2 n=1 Tax=Ipomoea nil TaxID=35883 RepID=UPI0009017C13|nr:PREDICTED: eukaryotic translation initiation factor 5B-like isoform X2 [Ipomoea nil]